MDWHRIWARDLFDARDLGARATDHRQQCAVRLPTGVRAVRLCLRHRGDEPLTLTASVRAGSNEHVVTFDGAPELVLPADGGEVVTDPVTLAVDGELVVTTSVTGSSPVLGALRLLIPPASTAVTTAGDLAVPGATPELDFVLEYVPGAALLYGLTAVEVQTGDNALAAVVAFGDSITDVGVWTEPFARRLPPDRFVRNAGISGNRLLHDGAMPMFGPAGVRRFATTAFDCGPVRSIIALLGINDLCHPTEFGRPDEAVSAAQLVAGYEQLSRECDRHGARLVLGTLLPFGGHPAWTPELEAIRTEVNAWIHHTPLADVADFDAAVRDPHDPIRITDGLHVGDHLHPNDVGGEAMAAAIDLDLIR